MSLPHPDTSLLVHRVHCRVIRSCIVKTLTMSWNNPQKSDETKKTTPIRYFYFWNCDGFVVSSAQIFVLYETSRFSSSPNLSFHSSEISDVREKLLSHDSQHTLRDSKRTPPEQKVQALQLEQIFRFPFEISTDVIIVFSRFMGVCVCGYRRGMDRWMDLSTTYTHHTELQIFRALSHSHLQNAVSSLAVSWQRLLIVEILQLR
jgi:hypothetical protein